MRGTKLSAITLVVVTVFCSLAGCGHRPNDRGSASSVVQTSTDARTPGTAGSASGPTGPVGLTGPSTAAQTPVTSAAALAAALLPQGQVSRIVGAEIAKTNPLDRPYRAIESTNPGCNVVQGMTIESFGGDWQAFGGTEMLAGDANGVDVSVYQGVAAYHDGDAAGRRFRATASALTGCDGVSLRYRDSGMEIPVTVTVAPSRESDASWLVAYPPSTYRCFASIRKVTNAVVQTQICAYGSSRDMVQEVTGQIVARLGVGD